MSFILSPSFNFGIKDICVDKRDQFFYLNRVTGVYSFLACQKLDETQ